MTTARLTPAEMADRTGVTIDTLRYYEREGLIQNVARAESGHRRYSEDEVLWVEVLRCLRDTGMTIEQLRHYCHLGAQGDHTEPERRRILIEHRATVETQIAERVCIVTVKMPVGETGIWPLSAGVYALIGRSQGLMATHSAGS